MTPALLTARLVLRPLTVADADLLFDEMRDPEHFRYIPRDPPQTRDELRAMFARFAAGPAHADETWDNWIVVRRDDEAPIGSVQLTIRQDRTATFGYWILRSQWRQGYAREACTAVLDHLARGRRALRAVAEIDVRNAASLALVEALGFTRVAETANADFFKGSPSDEARYELDLANRHTTDSRADRRNRRRR
ncbi:MAG: GNAT family N-acetyltransferase [Vulcanimicrobiaceae bacterium]